MMQRSEFEQLMDEAGDPRRIEQQLLLLDAAELISRLMQENGVSRTELAQRIGKSKGFVTQVLSGHHNMTLRTLADLAGALQTRIRVHEADSFWSFAGDDHAVGRTTARPRTKLVFVNTGVAA